MTLLWRTLAGRDDASRPGLPISEVLAPLPLIALATLVVNDWLLKPTLGGSIGWLTGKLSDFAGLALAPLVLTATIDLLLHVARAMGAQVDPTLRRWKLALAGTATGLVFIAVKVSPAVAILVASTWGHVWPSATIVADPTDLFALPALGLAWWQGRRTIAWVPYGRIAWAADQIRRRPAPVAAFDDVIACGGDPRQVGALQATMTDWLRGGSVSAVNSAVERLRRGESRLR